MPQDIDYEFGKAAVGRGALTQEQLEECVEVLVALERVGSHKRLWDVIAGKGYLSDALIAEIQRDLGKPSVEQPSKQNVLSEMIILDEETSDDLDLPTPVEEGNILVHLIPGEAPELHPLPMRLVTLGKDDSCDVTLPEAGVEKQHTQITCGAGKFMISDRGTRNGVIVNGQRVSHRRLMPNDLIQLGSARLLFLSDYGEESAPQSISPVTVEGEIAGRLRVAEGPHQGTSFFIGMAPLVIGRHKLAGARLDHEEVAPFHAQVLATTHGIRILDLGSSTGTRVNGTAVSARTLKHGDNITIGPSRLHYTAMGSTLMNAQGEEDAEESESKLDFEIPDDIEVEAVPSPLARAGIEAEIREESDLLPPKPYKPGDLELNCIQGPPEGKSFFLAEKTIVIGRDQGCRIRIVDPSVSRRHAEIVFSSACATIRDLGSRNGIHLNGKQVTEAPLRAGNTLRIGKCLFIVDETAPKASRKKKR